MTERKLSKLQIWVFRKPLRGKLEALVFQLVDAKGSAWVGVEGDFQPSETPEAAARQAVLLRTGLDLRPELLQFVEGSPGLFAVLLSGDKPPLQPDLKEYQAYSWIPSQEADELLKAAADRKTFQKALKWVT